MSADQMGLIHRTAPSFVHSSLLRKDGTFMPVRYDQDTKARAIRLVREHAGDTGSAQSTPGMCGRLVTVRGRAGGGHAVFSWFRRYKRCGRGVADSRGSGVPSARRAGAWPRCRDQLPAGRVDPKSEKLAASLGVVGLSKSQGSAMA
jgi:hypothetical protein